jgi:hypothetical protein
MVLHENVYAKNDALLMKAGQVLTSVSINHFSDLRSVLRSTNFVVMEE